ncbi:hypothetical protein [Senegalia massiliensis]|uniref:Uncharacterized protein n=1 Tax=Senegalia massiliensis TaxID=1720316 RepID=A0A845R0K1_9CLOT|nr:hypothetical protein [Senegalia massiliensis]NBI07529.1 hypothetical protein [Senegalia massiliensis]
MLNLSNERCVLKMTTILKGTSRKRKVKGNFRFRTFITISVLFIGLLIVNKGTFTLFQQKDYEETAEIMANFMVAEYERQSENGKVDMNKIVSMAEKLDDTNSLSVNYSDSSYMDRVTITFSLDGGKTIKYKDLKLN